MIPKAGKLKRLIKSLMVGLAAGTGRISPPAPSEPSPIRDEWQNLDRAHADYRVRTPGFGSVRYTYNGPMIGLHEGGILNRTPTWKTVTDRNLKNMCIEGTGWSDSET